MTDEEIKKMNEHCEYMTKVISKDSDVVNKELLNSWMMASYMDRRGIKADRILELVKKSMTATDEEL